MCTPYLGYINVMGDLRYCSDSVCTSIGGLHFNIIVLTQVFVVRKSCHEKWGDVHDIVHLGTCTLAFNIQSVQHNVMFRLCELISDRKSQ